MGEFKTDFCETADHSHAHKCNMCRAQRVIGILRAPSGHRQRRSALLDLQQQQQQ